MNRSLKLEIAAVLVGLAFAFLVFKPSVRTKEIFSTKSGAFEYKLIERANHKVTHSIYSYELVVTDLKGQKSHAGSVRVAGNLNLRPGDESLLVFPVSGAQAVDFIDVSSNKRIINIEFDSGATDVKTIEAIAQDMRESQKSFLSRLESYSSQSNSVLTEWRDAKLIGFVVIASKDGHKDFRFQCDDNSFVYVDTMGKVWYERRNENQTLSTVVARIDPESGKLYPAQDALAVIPAESKNVRQFLVGCKTESKRTMIDTYKLNQAE